MEQQWRLGAAAVEDQQMLVQAAPAMLVPYEGQRRRRASQNHAALGNGAADHIAWVELCPDCHNRLAYPQANLRNHGLGEVFDGLDLRELSRHEPCSGGVAGDTALRPAEERQ